MAYPGMEIGRHQITSLIVLNRNHRLHATPSVVDLVQEKGWRNLSFVDLCELT